MNEKQIQDMTKDELTDASNNKVLPLDFRKDCAIERTKRMNNDIQKMLQARKGVELDVQT